MKGLLFGVLVGFLIEMGTVLAGEDPEAGVPEDLLQLVNATFICKFKDHVLPENIPAAVNEIVKQAGASSRYVYTRALHGFSAYMSPTSANNLALHNPNIEYCEANALIKAGGTLVQAGKGQGNGAVSSEPEPQFVPEGVTRVGGPRDGTGLTAWIIDSGIDLDNADLNVDASRGIDVVKINGKGTVDDVYGHGTHVAGILAAIDNDINVVGVAAGATVIPVRVLKASSFGTVDAAIAGIDFVANNAQPGEVANMSAWWWDHHQAFHEAAANLADIIPFIVIAGNDGADLNEKPSEPAHVEHPNLITVSAIDHKDKYADFSNWGFAGDWPRCDETAPAYDPNLCATVDYAAPGVDVTSLQPDGGLATWWGTSMAAPHLAGIILLLQHTTPVLSPNTDGVAIKDPDSHKDPIAVH